MTTNSLSHSKDRRMTAATTTDRASELADLASAVEDAADRVIRAAETTHRAREACNGQFSGLELENRVKALAACAQAEHLAVSEYRSAKAALAAMEREG